MSDAWKPGRKLVGRIDPPNPRCDSCGDELTDDEMDFGTDEGGQMCNPCYRSENEDPDARLGGHDNPYPTWEDTILHSPDSDFWRS